MQRLYDARLAGHPAGAAVREASLGTLRALREHGQSPHPRLWGAFIAM
jgi:hypothetical protein